ncbi:hypothetical protein WJX72_011678 [[Myrmecia] bisecta]|uniref:Cyclin-like domain-containing protein n=1 Tax=[Myrmecia] bisecta TaxID=41462 RepID=A0AAW1QSU5_9CHLO
MSRMQQQTCRSGVLIKATAELLRLPPVVATTALVMLHRFSKAAPEHQLDPTDVVSACLFVAAKVEEAPVRTNDLVNAVRFEAELRHAGNAAAGSGAVAAYHMLVGHDYYSVKERLIQHEQLLLRTLHFDISMEHPHKYLLNYCATLRCSQPLAQLAICLLNDSLLYTTLCLSHAPAEVAGGALHLAAVLLGRADSLPSQPPHCWWECLGLRRPDIEEVGNVMLDMLQ